ncbi:polyphosphate kinase 1 [Methylococcus capsulatus]|uniref:polyphosphate kinase 1 n=1 Tax=Methylococcus capsulatus TaxID=414 RepID=UPI002FD8C1F1
MNPETAKPATAAEHFFDRELSWLEFNDRVLQEALDARTPLVERLKFVAIFSSNLDEFFMVRISGLIERERAGAAGSAPAGMAPSQQLDAIRTHLARQTALQHRLFDGELRELMKQHGILLLDYAALDEPQRGALEAHFSGQVFPVLTPLSVDAGHPFPQMSNLSLNLAVIVEDPVNGLRKFARIKVPDTLPRFVALPQGPDQAGWTGVPLEQLIAGNLARLFPGMIVRGHHMFRITRDADFTVREDEAEDLMLAIEEEVGKRHLDGFVCRLEIERSMPAELRESLMEELEVSSRDVYEFDGLLNLRDLFYFLSLPLPELKDMPWTPVVPAPFQAAPDESGEPRATLFDAIKTGDVLVHHPYHSFAATVQEFITQAAHDPQVLAIKLTLYRTSGDSPIVRALIAAAAARKQVVALIELKARFDEENNIAWANRLEDAGAHVVYGVVGLKTHTKIALVVRKEEEALRRYVHVGTGNYNPKTANLYTDLGLLSCRDDLVADVGDLFNYLTGYSRQDAYRKLLVAPLTLRRRMYELITREMEHARSGAGGHIVAKMNALVDPEMIRHLYEASRAGVRIELVVRGICCLRPGVPGLSENIRVISVVGRYLEHSRIFRFKNGGADEYYIGSADWMTRNLDHRVEAVTPVEDAAAVHHLEQVLAFLLNDNRHAWDLQSDGRYLQRQPAEGEPERAAQALLMEGARLGEF